MRDKLHILVDADACPNLTKQIIFRAAMRLRINTTLFANHSVAIPRNPLFKLVHVLGGFDVADQKIIDTVQPGDLVITADIPLAAAVIDKKAYALNPRGELYTTANIKQRLAMRNFMEDMRNSGHITDGPSPLHQRDQQAFANALDKFLVVHHKNRS